MKALKSNIEGRQCQLKTECQWWNQVKADMRKIGAADAEDRLEWRGLADLRNGFPALN